MIWYINDVMEDKLQWNKYENVFYMLDINNIHDTFSIKDINEIIINEIILFYEAFFFLRSDNGG